MAYDLRPIRVPAENVGRILAAIERALDADGSMYIYNFSACRVTAAVVTAAAKAFSSADLWGESCGLRFTDDIKKAYEWACIAPERYPLTASDLQWLKETAEKTGPKSAQIIARHGTEFDPVGVLFDTRRKSARLVNFFELRGVLMSAFAERLTHYARTGEALNAFDFWCGMEHWGECGGAVGRVEDLITRIDDETENAN